MTEDTSMHEAGDTTSHKPENATMCTTVHRTGHEAELAAERKKHCPQIRALALISGIKDAERAEKLFASEKQLVFYQLRGHGTASSEMMDLLGLGSTAKVLSLSIMHKAQADAVLAQLEKDLRLGEPGTGIAFTTIMSGVSAMAMKVADEYARRELFEKMEQEVKKAVAASHKSLIIAVVNVGFSEDVMDAAREFGAGGGTVLHARQAGGEAILNILGVPIQEEKELILIISKAEQKVAIMKAIGEKFGIKSEAQGLVLSTPIDSIVGLGESD